MTQAQLAKLSGLSKLTVLKVESGTMEPTLVTAFKISDALNIRFDDLRRAVI